MDVLVIHDQPHLRQLLFDEVRRSGLAPVAAFDLEHACSAQSSSSDYGVVLAGVPRGERPVTIVKQVKTEWPMAEIIVIGSSSDLAEATDAVRHGAYDYITAPADPARLNRALRGAAERRGVVSDHRWRMSACDSEDAIFADPVTRAVFAKATRAAAVNSTVLITGESGTGKEVLARRIHRLSNRQRGKFVPVNCGSLPESLIETELFGYKKGAFTGAASDSKGLIEDAEGGVLFLDEIGDMPLSMQVRLLRFLDSGEIRAVGSTVVKHVDVRVVAATNRCLLTEVRDRRFREDLYFRLSVVWLELPPLRERRADIPPLVAFHTRRAATKLGVPVPRISEAALDMLLRYRWPGNIRELQNAMEQAIVQDGSGIITPDALPASVQRVLSAIGPVLSSLITDPGEQLETVLRQHRGNRTHAAAALGISRTTLWRRLRQLNAPAVGLPVPWAAP
ncbi:MAG TPA: sigma-54 dependent transcriptional regulator [Vicinamibacterales bacterium]|nr:sigma-54 dependent transcriptional regulator [Vicinamibacterales bacterium]